MIGALKFLPSARSKGCAIMVMLLTGVLGVACLHEERSYGISREARLSRYPDPKCVAFALRKVRRVMNVDHTYSTQREKISTRSRFQFATYTRGSVTVALGISEDPSHVRFGQHYLFVNRKPSVHEIRAARELMKDVELSLERECNLAGLSERIQEYCEGMDCD